MASLSILYFFSRMLSECSVTWFDHRELWIEIVFDETFLVGNFFIYVCPQHYDIFLYHVEMPKIPNFYIYVQVQITSGALHVSMFWSRERRLFAWQIKTKSSVSRDCLNRAQRGKRFATILGTPWKHRAQRGKRFATILGTPWKQDLLRYIIT